MTMTLYHGEPNGPSLTVLAMLDEKGLVADLVRIDLARMGRHGVECPRNIMVEMSVEGEGPVLVADGEAMSDSLFIACYLDDVGDGPALRPSDPYARWEMMMWCRQIIERLAPAAVYLGCKAYLHDALGAMPDEDYAVRAASIASVDLRERWDDVRHGNFAGDKLADSRAKVVQAVGRCEARLADREWLMDDFSIADLETYAWLAGMTELMPEAFGGAPRTQGWLWRVRTRRSVSRTLALASVVEPGKSWAPGPEINRWG